MTAEWVRYLDPDTNRLRLVEYREFVADAVRTIFSEIDDLRTRWRKRTTRDEIVEALAAKGIDLGELGERTGLIEADPLDVLVHIAWNQPLATRTDRARRVRKENADFFDRYQPEARAVLEELRCGASTRTAPTVPRSSAVRVTPNGSSSISSTA